MKKWQRYWLYFLIFYSSIHIIRDLFQDFGIQNVLSTVLVKSTPLKAPWLWRTANTYILALIKIMLAIASLKLNRFGKIGYLTIFIAISILVLWSFYWFFL